MILVVDDNVDFAESLADIFLEEGYQVEIVFSGDEAIERIKKNSFKIALMDIRMPGLDGVKALKIIKEIDPAVAVILMTGFSDDNIIEEAVTAGADKILFKPLDINSLLSFVKTKLKKKKCENKI